VVLLGVLGVAYRNGPDTGAIFGFAAGLTLDLFLRTPFGLSALAFSVTGFLLGVLQASILRTTRWMIPVLGAVGCLVGNLLFRGFGTLVGEEPLLNGHSVRVMLIAAACDAVLAPVIFLFAGWAAGEGPTSARMLSSASSHSRGDAYIAGTEDVSRKPARRAEARTRSRVKTCLSG
jgi:rod shape-determining protein MreD